MRLILISLLSAILLTILPSPFHAQQTVNPDIIKAESDYRTQFDLYRQAYQQYQIAKSEWQKTNTIRSEQQALDAAKKASLARTEVQKAYTLWVRLRLLSFTAIYQPAQEIADDLSEQYHELATDQATVNTTQSVMDFDKQMEEYYSKKEARDRLFASAQIHLKLAEVSSFQHFARSLYEPVLVKLSDKQEIPEVKQGQSKVAALAEVINLEITKTQGTIGSLESQDLAINQVFRKASESLEIIRANQIELLTLMNELDTRYAN